MELNLHATREEGEPGVRPKAVLWQHDARRPLNPCGLLLAYEEETVKPVVSDIDAFLIGSEGMRFEATSSEQVQMISWCIDNIESLLETPAAEPRTLYSAVRLMTETCSCSRPSVASGPPTAIGTKPRLA